MNQTWNNKKARGFIFILLICFSGFNGLILIFNSNNESSFLNANLNENIESSSYEMSSSPFFNHSEDDFLSYESLEHEFSPEFSVFRHSLDESSQIADSNHYAADQFLYILGMGNFVFQDDETAISEFYDSLQTTQLWDDNDAGGFYSEIDDDFELSTSLKTSYDNLLAILSLFEGLNYGGSERIASQWETVKTLFWDVNREGFNHSTEVTTELFSVDNFLAASTLFRITRELGGLIGADSFTYANETMNLFNSSMYDELNPSFYTFMNSDGDDHNDTTNKLLLPNALGISALLDWNIAENFDKNSSKVQQSEKIWNFLKENFYNDTFQLFMSETDQDGSTIQDYKMNLQDNAWMLKSTLDLFKTTGNISYYEASLDLYYGIEDNLYDQSNFGYNSSTGFGGTGIKNFDDYNLLLYSLNDFFTIFSSSVLTADANQNQYIYIVDDNFNVTINFNISMIFDFTSTIGVNWNIETPVESAQISYNLRFPNNTLIHELDSSLTNSTGSDEYVYNYPADLPVGDYVLSVYCNKSGYAVAFADVNLEIKSGIVINSFENLFSSNSLHQGESGSLNVTVRSLRSDNLSVSVEVSGQYFESIIFPAKMILNNSDTIVLVDITVRNTAILGDQQLEIKFFNNSILLGSKNHTITISSSIEIGMPIYDRIIDFQQLEISVPITNLSTADSGIILMSVNGDNFDSIIKNISSITYLETNYESIALITNENAFLGTLEFNLTFSRDRISFYSKTFNIESVQEIEILSISGSTNVIHGQAPLISLELINNNFTAKTLTLKVNGVIRSTFSVSWGQNIKHIPIASLILNPYDLTQKTYNVEILNENGGILATHTVTTNITPSAFNVFMFYALPIIIPIGIILFFKKKDLEYDKRNK